MESWIGRLVKPGAYAQNGWESFQTRDGGTVLVGTFNPESWDEIDELGEASLGFVEVQIHVVENKIEDYRPLGEYLPCSGRSIGGAPAHIFPQNPMGEIYWEEIPIEIRNRAIQAVDAISSGENPRQIV